MRSEQCSIMYTQARLESSKRGLYSIRMLKRRNIKVQSSFLALHVYLRRWKCTCHHTRAAESQRRGGRRKLRWDLGPVTLENHMLGIGL